MIRVERDAGWEELRRLAKTMGPKFQVAWRAALRREAEFLRKKIADGLRSGAPGGKAFAPYSPLTVALGNAGKSPLAKLAPQIAVVPTVGGGLMIVVRGAGRGGMTNTDLAAIHQAGMEYTVTLTPRARRYLMAKMRERGILQKAAREKGAGNGGVIRIKIPARPFVKPVLDAYAKPEQVGERFIASVMKTMGGDFGRP